MKTKYLIISILTSIVFLTSCSSPVEEIPNTVFSGIIKGSEVDTILVFNSLNKIKIPVDSGSFKDTIKIDDGYYTLKIGSETTAMYWKDGYNISLSIDTKEFDETIKYNGDGSIENNLLATLYITREQISPGQRDLYTSNEKDFVKSLKVVYDSLKTIIDISRADDQLKQDQLDELDYKYAQEVQNYPSYYKFFTKNDSFQLSENYSNHQIDFDKENEEAYKRSSTYQNLINNFYFKIARDYRDSGSTIIEGMQLSIDSIQNVYIKDNVLKFYSRYVLEPNEELENGYRFLDRNVTDEEYRKKFKEVYDLQKTLTAGMPSPEFNNYENHSGGQNSLADYRGSYVYIDVWATWCGPCIREIPSLKEMDKKYEGKNLKIISISIDTKNDHDKWKSFVDDKELSGIHLFAPDNWRSEFVEAYNIKGIPRFILVDKEGLIIDSDAPRPSSDEIHEVIAGLEI